jgi:cell division septation protein DedD
MQVMQAAKKESSSSFPAKPPASTPNAWSVQIQATRDYEGAQQMVRDLQSRGYAPTVSRVTRDGEIWYRIRVGSFASAEEAQSSVEHLRREGRFPRAYLVSN